MTRRNFLRGAALAAAAALVIVPVAVRQRLPGRGSAPAEVAEAERWQEPDLDTLWQDTEVLELEETAWSGQDSAAYAAYDGG
jgi:hypothetical protein